MVDEHRFGLPPHVQKERGDTRRLARSTRFQRHTFAVSLTLSVLGEGGWSAARCAAGYVAVSPRRFGSWYGTAAAIAATVGATWLTTAKTTCLGVANHLPNRNSDWSFFPMAF